MPGSPSLSPRNKMLSLAVTVASRRGSRGHCGLGCVRPRTAIAILAGVALLLLLWNSDQTARLASSAAEFARHQREDESNKGYSGNEAAGAPVNTATGRRTAAVGGLEPDRSECPVCLPCSDRGSVMPPSVRKAGSDSTSGRGGRGGEYDDAEDEWGSGSGRWNEDDASVQNAAAPRRRRKHQQARRKLRSHDRGDEDDGEDDGEASSASRNTTMPVAHVSFAHPHMTSSPKQEYWAPGAASDRVSFPFVGRERGSFERITNGRAPRAPLLLRRRALLAIPVSGRSKTNVAPLIDLFHQEGMDVMLFHYDMSDWSDVEHVAAHASVRAVGQTKFWFAKRYLAPHILENYDYLFLWDDDVGLPAGWSPMRFLAIMQHYGLHVAQPALASGTRENPQHDVVRLHDDVMADGFPGRLTSFVEVMFPVFSREAWRDCIWESIPYDGRSFWGVDNVWYPHCASAGYCRFAVIDSMPVHHRDTRTLSQNADANLQELAHYVQMYKSTLCAPKALSDARRAAKLEELDEQAIAHARAAAGLKASDPSPIVPTARRVALRRMLAICKFIAARPLGFDFLTLRRIDPVKDRKDTATCPDTKQFQGVANRPWYGDDPAAPLPVPKF